MTDQGRTDEGHTATGADADRARADYERELTRLLADPDLERVAIECAEIARRAQQFLRPATYRRARRPIPDPAARYALAVEYITRARAELRPRRPDREDTR